MCFDIGYSVEMDDDAIIDQKIAVMEQQLTFVLLTDYFDESLILMKNKLCWDWDDVVYVKFKMRIEEAKATVSKKNCDFITAIYFHTGKMFV